MSYDLLMILQVLLLRLPILVLPPLQLRLSVSVISLLVVPISTTVKIRFVVVNCFPRIGISIVVVIIVVAVITETVDMTVGS